MEYEKLLENLDLTLDLIHNGTVNAVFIGYRLSLVDRKPILRCYLEFQLALDWLIYKLPKEQVDQCFPDLENHFKLFPETKIKLSNDYLLVKEKYPRYFNK